MLRRRRCFERQRPSFSKATPATNYALALAALGEAQIEGGQASDAVDTLTQAQSLFGKLHPTMSPDRADLLVSLSPRADCRWSRRGSGRLSRPGGHLLAFLRPGQPPHRGRVAVARPAALFAAGRVQKAAETLDQASAMFRTAGLPAERALLLQTNAK